MSRKRSRRKQLETDRHQNTSQQPASVLSRLLAGDEIGVGDPAFYPAVDAGQLHVQVERMTYPHWRGKHGVDDLKAAGIDISWRQPPVSPAAETDRRPEVAVAAGDQQQVEAIGQSVLDSFMQASSEAAGDGTMAVSKRDHGPLPGPAKTPLGLVKIGGDEE